MVDARSRPLAIFFAHSKLAEMTSRLKILTFSLETETYPGIKNPSKFVNSANIRWLSQVFKCTAAVRIISHPPPAVKIKIVANAGKYTNLGFSDMKRVPKYLDGRFGNEACPVKRK